MLSYNYTQPQFINEYNREIGYIISLVKEKCKNKGYIIKDEKNLFKNLLYIIFIYSDKKKLKD